MNILLNAALTDFCEMCHLLWLDQFSKVSQCIDFTSTLTQELLQEVFKIFSLQNGKNTWSVQILFSNIFWDFLCRQIENGYFLDISSLFTMSNVLIYLFCKFFLEIFTAISLRILIPVHKMSWPLVLPWPGGCLFVWGRCSWRRCKSTTDFSLE